MKIIYYLLIFIIGCTGCNHETEKYEMNYVPFSNSVIHVNIQNNLVDTLFIEARANTNIPRGGSESNTLTVNKKGNYYLEIEIDRPAKSILKISDNQYNVMLFPNDTTHIEINTSNTEFEFTFYGRGKAMNDYYLEKKNNLGYTDIRYPLNKSLTSRATYYSLKKVTDSATNQELTFLNEYSLSHHLPKWFLDYENAEIVYSGAGFKTQIPHYNEIFKIFKDTLPSNYFDFLEHTEIDNEQAILSSNYLWFLDDYFLKDLPVNEFNQLSGFSRINRIMSHILNHSTNQLSVDTKEVYHMYNFSSLIKYYSDSLAIDSLAKEFQLTDYKELIKISGTRSKDGIQMLNLNQGDTIPDFIVINELDSLVSIREFQHQVLYLNFWATWCGPCIKNIPELNKLITQFEDDTRIKFLNICLDSEKDKWLTSIAKHNLKGTNLISEGNWNSRLISYFNIKEIPHYVIIGKGNILYENFTDKAPMVQSKIERLLEATPHNSR